MKKIGLIATLCLIFIAAFVSSGIHAQSMDQTAYNASQSAQYAPAVGSTDAGGYGSVVYALGDGSVPVGFENVRSVWVPGHHDRYGRWIPGHYRHTHRHHHHHRYGRVWVPGHYNRYGRWVPGHYRYRGWTQGSMYFPSFGLNSPANQGVLSL